MKRKFRRIPLVSRGPVAVHLSAPHCTASRRCGCAIYVCIYLRTYVRTSVCVCVCICVSLCVACTSATDNNEPETKATYNADVELD